MGPPRRNHRGGESACTMQATAEQQLRRHSKRAPRCREHLHPVDTGWVLGRDDVRDAHFREARIHQIRAVGRTAKPAADDFIGGCWTGRQIFGNCRPFVSLAGCPVGRPAAVTRAMSELPHRRQGAGMRGRRAFECGGACKRRGWTETFGAAALTPRSHVVHQFKHTCAYRVRGAGRRRREWCGKDDPELWAAIRRANFPEGGVGQRHAELLPEQSLERGAVTIAVANPDAQCRCAGRPIRGARHRLCE